MVSELALNQRICKYTEDNLNSMLVKSFLVKDSAVNMFSRGEHFCGSITKSLTY